MRENVARVTLLHLFSVFRVTLSAVGAMAVSLISRKDASGSEVIGTQALSLFSLSNGTSVLFH